MSLGKGGWDCGAACYTCETWTRTHGDAKVHGQGVGACGDVGQLYRLPRPPYYGPTTQQGELQHGAQGSAVRGQGPEGVHRPRGAHGIYDGGQGGSVQVGGQLYVG